jgi:guanylate kinase
VSGLLFVFSGPAGAGKNTIMQAVMERDPRLAQLPTATTRPMRDNEQQGREHEFITEDEFRQRILNKELVEWQIIHDKGIYGVPRATIQEAIRQGKWLVADVDVLGAMQLKQEFGEHLVLIFVSAPDLDTLENRLRQRSNTIEEDDLKARLRRAEFEMGFADQYDYHLYNQDGELEAVVESAQEIVNQEIARPRTLNEARLGWQPAAIHEVVTGLLIQQGQILVQANQLPQFEIPAANQTLPFEIVRTQFTQALGTLVLPTRPDAIYRKVDIGFEPPQLVQAHRDNGHIRKNYIFVIEAASPLSTLPSGWTFIPIDSLPLDRTIREILRQTQLSLLSNPR